MFTKHSNLQTTAATAIYYVEIVLWRNVFIKKCYNIIYYNIFYSGLLDKKLIKWLMEPKGINHLSYSFPLHWDFCDTPSCLSLFVLCHL